MSITNEYREMYSYIIEIYNSLYSLILHNNFLNGLCLYVYKLVENNDNNSYNTKRKHHDCLC